MAGATAVVAEERQIPAVRLAEELPVVATPRTAPEQTMDFQEQLTLAAVVAALLAVLRVMVVLATA